MPQAFKKIPFERNGVRVVIDRRPPIEVCANSRMSVEEARAFIESIYSAIDCYCDELQKVGYLPHWVAAERAG